jgi:hypothetical protein
VAARICPSHLHRLLSFECWSDPNLGQDTGIEREIDSIGVSSIHLGRELLDSIGSGDSRASSASRGKGIGVLIYSYFEFFFSST